MTRDETKREKLLRLCGLLRGDASRNRPGSAINIDICDFVESVLNPPADVAAAMARLRSLNRTCLDEFDRDDRNTAARKIANHFLSLTDQTGDAT